MSFERFCFEFVKFFRWSMEMDTVIRAVGGGGGAISITAEDATACASN
jgi:hypothetical protein